MTVAFGPSGSCSRRRATSSFARVMSADTWSWKTGTCHASVSRRAIVLRMLVSARALDLARRGGARAGAAPGAPRTLGALDVLGDDPPLGAGARERRELDPALAGDPARERRGLDPAAVLRRRAAAPRRSARRPTSRPRSRSGSRAGPGEPSSCGPRRPSAPRCAPLPLALGSLLALLADERDRLADRHLALGDRDLQQHAGASASTSCVTLSVSSS